MADLGILVCISRDAWGESLPLSVQMYDRLGGFTRIIILNRPRTITLGD